jgi:hypothetical protein
MTVIYCLNRVLLRSKNNSFICLFCFCLQKMAFLCVIHTLYFLATCIISILSCIFPHIYIYIYMSRVYYSLCISGCVFIVFYTTYMSDKSCFEQMSSLIYILYGTILALETIHTTIVVLITIVLLRLYMFLYDISSFIYYFHVDAFLKCWLLFWFLFRSM